MHDIIIEQEDPRRADVVALVGALNAHDEALYPPEANFHLDIDTLCSPDVIFLVARQDGVAVGIGALWLRTQWKLGEVKRMYVSPKARGQGLASRILAMIEKLARDHKVTQLVLETGTLSADAHKLYERAGFSRRGPFADYPDAPLSVFMEKLLIS